MIGFQLPNLYNLEPPQYIDSEFAFKIYDPIVSYVINECIPLLFTLILSLLVIFIRNAIRNLLNRIVN